MSFVSGKNVVAKTLAVLSVAALVPKVAAHGFINSVEAGGRSWTGFDESTWTNKAQDSAVLITDYLTPMYDVNSREIACGINPQGARNIATVSAGSSIGWHWLTHNGANYKSWTHNEGTHRSFIGPCIGDCGSTDPTQVEWTEIGPEYTGQQTWDGNSWPVRQLANGQPWWDKVPSAPNGDYLIRNELTALHYSTKPQQSWDDSVQHGWGTEFYVTCMAIRIENSDGSWDMNQAVKFPGAYTVDQRGHYNPNLWGDPGSAIISSLNSFPRTYGPPGNSNSGSSDTGSDGNDNGGGDNDSNNDTDNDIDIGGDDHGSGNTEGDSGYNSGGNSGASSEGDDAASSSSPSSTPTVSPTVCNRRKKRSLASLGRRHHRHHRQARRLTGGY